MIFFTVQSCYEE